MASGLAGRKQSPRGADLQDTATKAASGSAADQAKREGAEPTSYYGLEVLPPLSAIVELSVIVALLLAVDWLLPALDINNIQPSPYWLPVLLLTLHYGTASGTLAVIVAIVAYFSLVTLPEQGVGENEFAYRLRILSQPILWIATAVLLGQFRMVQISAKRELRRRLAELETQRNTLANYAQRLRTRCDMLERDIAARPATAAAPLLEAFATLAATKDGLAAATQAAFASAFPGAAVSLYSRSETGLTKVASNGWPSQPPWATELDATHPLAKAIVAGKVKPTVLDSTDDIILAGQGLAAVPVVEPLSGKVIGMIKLESADASVVSEGLIAQLDVLAAAVGPALTRIDLASYREPGVLERNLLKAGR